MFLGPLLCCHFWQVSVCTSSVNYMDLIVNSVREGIFGFWIKGMYLYSLSLAQVIQCMWYWKHTRQIELTKSCASELKPTQEKDVQNKVNDFSFVCSSW